MRTPAPGTMCADCGCCLAAIYADDAPICWECDAGTRDGCTNHAAAGERYCSKRHYYWIVRERSAQGTARKAPKIDHKTVNAYASDGQVMENGKCRYCGCDEMHACRLADGDACAWFDRDRTVCTNPMCIRQLDGAQKKAQRELRRSRPRKRTPAEIHALMMEERRERRRRSRARKQRAA